MKDCKVYRYEFVKDDFRIGILTGLDYHFTMDEIFEVCGIFEMALKCPPIDMRNSKSFFTDKGNRKFRKGIRKIKDIATTKGIVVDCIVKDMSELKDILYSDNYQIIVNNPM